MNKKQKTHFMKRSPAVLACYLTCILLLIGIGEACGIKTKAAIPGAVTDQASYIQWLQKTGKPAYSRYHGYTANYDVYKKYCLLSYGTPQNVPNNRYDSKTGEYAAHGFSYDEYQVTNTYFRDDTTGVSDPRNWNNRALGQDAAVSWMRLTAREKEHIKAANLYYKGNSFGGISFSSLRLNESQCIVIAVPSWNLGFALYTSHYNSKGELRYGTLNGNGIGGVEISGTIKPQPVSSNPVFTILPGENQVDLSFAVQSSISKYTGLAKSSDIGRGGIIFNGRETEKSGAGPWTATETLRFTRIATDKTKDFTRSITLKAKIWAVSILGDLVSKEITYSFTVIEKANAEVKGSLSMKGAISLFDGKTTLMGYRLPKNPKRFLCFEQATLRLDVKQAPIPDYVVFYPVGGSAKKVMVTKYNSNNSGYAEMKYTIGILNSTLTWDNRRINLPYICSAVANYNGTETKFFLTGIEITGDIYDLVYLNSPGFQ